MSDVERFRYCQRASDKTPVVSCSVRILKKITDLSYTTLVSVGSFMGCTPARRTCQNPNSLNLDRATLDFPGQGAGGSFTIGIPPVKHPSVSGRVASGRTTLRRYLRRLLDASQVGPAVVGLIPVLVLNLSSTDGSDERLGDQTMDQETPGLPLVAEQDAEVSGTAHSRFENVARTSSRSGGLAADAAEGAARVDAFPLLVGGDGTPLFGCWRRGVWRGRLGAHRKGYSFRCHGSRRSTASRLPLF